MNKKTTLFNSFWQPVKQKLKPLKLFSFNSRPGKLRNGSSAASFSPVKLSTYPKRTKQEIKLIDRKPFGDRDKDKVPNWFDCKPLNKNLQGWNKNSPGWEEKRRKYYREYMKKYNTKPEVKAMKKELYDNKPGVKECREKRVERQKIKQIEKLMKKKNDYLDSSDFKGRPRIHMNTLLEEVSKMKKEDIGSIEPVELIEPVNEIKYKKVLNESKLNMNKYIRENELSKLKDIEESPNPKGGIIQELEKKEKEYIKKYIKEEKAEKEIRSLLKHEKKELYDNNYDNTSTHLLQLKDLKETPKSDGGIMNQIEDSDEAQELIEEVEDEEE